MIAWKTARLSCETDCHRHSSYKGVLGQTFESVIGRDSAVNGTWEKMSTDVTEFKRHWGKACFAPIYGFDSKVTVTWSMSLHPNMV